MRYISGRVLGVHVYDPDRAKQRRPHTPLQKAKKEILALRAEVSRLHVLEASVLTTVRTRLRRGKKATMEAQFWEELRQALYEDQQPRAHSRHNERKAA